MSEIDVGRGELQGLAREQLRGVLAGVEPGVVAELRVALVAGRIDGGHYWRDGVGCVLGTITHACGSDDVAGDVMEAYPMRSRTVNAVEGWAWRIGPGDVPDASADVEAGPFRAAGLVAWIDEFEGERVSA